MKSLNLHGDYPKKVYRVLDKLEYANEFINGTFRIESVKFTGDNYGNDWTCLLEVVA